MRVRLTPCPPLINTKVQKFNSLISLLVLLLVSGMGEVHAQNTPPNGTEIINQAVTTFSQDGGATTLQTQSNAVYVVVEGVANFALEIDNSIKRFRGDKVFFDHYLVNNGDLASTFDIKIYNSEEGEYALENLTLESSQKSKFANTDTLSQVVTLQPGERFDFTYSGQINNLEKDSTTAILNIDAISREFDVSLQRRDSVYILSGSRIELNKVQSAGADLQSGDNFTYTIDGQNTGDATAYPRTISIDGISMDKVILLDSIPNNVSFERFISTDKGQRLYNYEGSGKFEFSSAEPTNPSEVSVIAVVFDSLEAGETFSATFEVRVNPGASGDIENIAEVSYVDPDGSVTTSSASNNVITTVAGGAKIDYFTDDSFEKRTGTTSIGSVLHIQASAASCNQFRTLVEEVTVRLTSFETGDREEFRALETGPNTSIFRITEDVPTRNGDQFEVVPGNRILETVEDDVIEAELQCDGINNGGGGGGARIQSTVVVDPFGIVFDSETNAPITGAEVSIYDITGANNGGNAGGLATVYEADGTTEAPSTYTTGIDGKFSFPYLEIGEYRIEVITPEGYSFASEVPFSLLPQGRKVDTLASYGKEWQLSNVPKGTDFDIPLDPLSKGVLFTEKTVDRKDAEIGDFVNYTVTIRSEAVNTVRNLSIDDSLPFGFSYQLGSAKLDGNALADPEGGEGPDLKFNVGDIESGATKELTYRVFVGPGSEKGEGINSAIATSDEVIVKSSNLAKVKVEVRGGLFNDNAYIIGKVFQDCNENDIQDAGEVGVPGVRLYLENGNYVVTDSEGKYTFYAIKPNKHVLKVDNYSLPNGSKLSVLDNRHANDPSSRFVDVKKGQMHRADFAICECEPAVNEEIEARRALFSENASQSLSGSLTSNFSANDNNLSSSQGRFEDASGTVGGPKEVKAASIKKDTKEDSTVAEATEVQSQVAKLEEALVNAEAGLGFLNISDNDTLLTDAYTVWAKGLNGAKFELYINGDKVDDKRVGQSSISPTNNLQGWEYVSLDFEAGRNELKLQEVDPFGNVRNEESIEIFVPGTLKKIDVRVPRNDVAADGVSSALVQVELLDENNLRVGSKTQITLDTEFGKWKVKDNDSSTPGTQTSIENGVAQFELTSTDKPQTAIVRATSGIIEGEAKVEFLPDLRPLIAAGIIEGTIRFNEAVNISSDKETDGFERELKQLSYSIENFTGDARLAFFLKGKVSGKTLLTAGYDSEKDKSDRLFRDIRPDEFYPVYGESSIKGFDAQSSSRLYVRVDRNKTYALYGDFITQERDQDVQLGNYSRAQTGLKANFEEGKIKAQAFGASAFSSRKIREFQGQGISRYDLPDKDIVENSEIIELVTYDREQPEVILSVDRLTRFRDYTIDPFSGVITFRTPVSSVDQDFNPVFIRATYEVTNNKDRYLIGGLNVEGQITNALKVGAGVVRDNNPDDTFTMVSGNVVANLSKDTKVVAEISNTNSDNNGSGSAGRVELNHRGKKLDVLAQVGKSEKDFSNQSSSLGQGRTEARTKTRYKLTNTTNVNAEFLYSRNDTTSDRTFGGLFTAQQSFGNNLSAEFGVRYSENYMASQDSTNYNTNLRGKLNADLPFLSGASVFAEGEQDLNDSDKKLIAIGADYRLKQLAKIYARHEFISSAGGINTLSSNRQRNNTVVGIDATYMKNGQIFSEYRVNDAFDGRSGQAAIGLRNQLQLANGIGANFGFERVFTLEGPSVNDGTAITTAIDVTRSSNWKATARAEARFTSNTDTYLNSIGYGLQLSKDWTFLTRNIISVTSQEGTSGVSKLQERFQLGAAYRSTATNKFDALFRYEFKHEIDKAIDDDFFRTAHVLSSHGNYHPSADWTFSGRIAAKYSIENDSQSKSESFLELISGRALYDINEKWDAGINASLLANSDFTTKDFGFGVEAGFLVATNLRLAAGYNFFGYDDEDLTANNYTQNGAYIGFSYKFDERMFDKLIPNKAKRSPIVDPTLYLQCEDTCEPLIVNTNPVDILPFTPAPFETSLAVADFKGKELNFERVEPMTVLPKHIHFNNNSTYINQPAAQMLDKVAKFLIERGDDYFIRVTGHTDSKSSQSYNLALSERRAKAVRAYLVAAGVNADLLQFEGLSYSKNAVPEKDRVDMAKNRRVELDLSVENRNVRFITQVEDLQVNPSIRGINNWDYIYIAEHNAVPSALNLTGSSLNRIHEYLIKRIALAMNEYQNVDLTIAAPSLEIANAISILLNAEGIDSNRIRVVNSASNGAVRFEYSNTEVLKVYEQNDDIELINNSRALSMMDNLLDILKNREDLILLRDYSQSYTVPNSVTFAGNQVELDNELRAIISRVGSYLYTNRAVTLRLVGNSSSSSAKRLEAIKTYLVNWGIDADKIEITTDESTVGSVIGLEYMNADSINLLKLDLINDGKGGGK